MLAYNYTNKNLSKFLVFLCWLVGAICFLATTISKYNLNTSNSLRIIHLYIIQIYHATIIFTFVCSYLFIWYRLRTPPNLKHFSVRKPYNDPSKADASSRKQNSTTTQVEFSDDSPLKDGKENNQLCEGEKERRRGSNGGSVASEEGTRGKFNYIPFFIVTTYILFVMVPEFLHYSMFHGNLPKSNTTIPSLMSMILFDFAALSECLLYPLINPSTKRSFCHLMRCKRLNSDPTYYLPDHQACVEIIT